MSIALRPDSVIRKSRVPTLAQMIREAQEFSKPKLKRLTREALLEWFAQSERLNIARIHHHLRGPRFIDFAERIGERFYRVRTLLVDLGDASTEAGRSRDVVHKARRT